jgi:hypothetical protein
MGKARFCCAAGRLAPLGSVASQKRIQLRRRIALVPELNKFTTPQMAKFAVKLRCFQETYSNTDTFCFDRGNKKLTHEAQICVMNPRRFSLNTPS